MSDGVIQITIVSQRQVQGRRRKQRIPFYSESTGCAVYLAAAEAAQYFWQGTWNLTNTAPLKGVPKTFVNYELFRKEALILKGIRDQAIPIVYDLAEDEQYSYLIEEYLEGDSLYALIRESGHCSSAMTIRYGIQICHLVHIMHSTMPTPVLYLDLQPKNLFTL